MTDPFSYWTRLMASWRLAGATGAQVAETAGASHDVIKARSDLMRDALLFPLTADYPELARMVPEKLEAFSAAGTAVMTAWWKAQGDYLTQTSRLTRMMTSGRVMTPMEFAEQWYRANLDLLRTVESGSRLGRDVIKPIHQTATANARRLRRSAPRA
jgi:hypothetical protein